MPTKTYSGLNIVSIGGGTGLSTLLSGLKIHVGQEAPPGRAPSPLWAETLTALVTVTDDGGSSGRLREEFQILPPGDIRNCMAALAEDERLLTKLFQYRFESDGDLSGHSFGNIFLAALTGVTGDFLEAIKLTSEVLAIKGRIFPSTMEDISLVAELEDGRVVLGETSIVQAGSRIKKLSLSRQHCQPLPETLEAIGQADLITIGPGSLYTSIIPNLLVSGIEEAISRSSALKIYICNIMTQPGETDGFSVEDHLRVLFEYSPSLHLDYVLVNSAPISRNLRQKYLAEGSVQVRLARKSRMRDSGPGIMNDGDDALPGGIKVISGALLNENDVVRHDPNKLADLLMHIMSLPSQVSESATRR
jgi:uncharacterized cofD-like protein